MWIEIGQFHPISRTLVFWQRNNMLKGILICGMLAVTSALPNPGTSCAAILCVEGTICKEKTINGVTQASCVVVRKGKCPAVKKDQFGVCVSSCTSDSDCNGRNKCCSNGCGTLCMAPVFGPTPPPRPACTGKQCPAGQRCVMRPVNCFTAPCNPQPTCVDPKPQECPDYPTNIAVRCAGEQKCSNPCEGGTICCPHPCGNQCVLPIPTKG